ncbi:MFS transporter [Specibacter sp. RAF43]|uniref:MFS transporter n=1 Tax=Specibacter sp. RAF43 TaxID=3233057 RepID=UPI003F950435
MYAEDKKLWTAPFILAIATNLFVTMVFYLTVTTMAVYAVDRFHASERAAGLAAGAFIIGTLCSRLFVGKFLDFVGRRRMMLAGLVGFVVTALLYNRADSVWMLVGIRIVQGVAVGGVTTALTAAVMGLIPERRRAEGIGYFGIATTISTAIGPFAAVLLVENAGYEALFNLATACAAAALVVALFLRPEERSPTAEERANKWRMKFNDVLEPSVLAISSVVLVAGAAYSGILTFLNSYAQSQDMAVAASTFFLVYAAVVLISRFFVGRIQDTFGDNAVVYPMLLAFAIGLVLVALAPNGIILALAGGFIGFGFGALMPTVQVIAVTMTESHRLGVALSAYFLVLDMGLGLGPVLLGILVSFTGFGGMYWVLAAAMFSTMGLYYLVHGSGRYRQGIAA